MRHRVVHVAVILAPLLFTSGAVFTVTRQEPGARVAGASVRADGPLRVSPAALARAQQVYQAEQQRQAVIGQIAADRQGAIDRIVSRWVDASADRPYGGHWQQVVEEALTRLSPGRLFEAQQAASYAQMIDVIMNGKALQPTRSSLLEAPNMLGSDGSDLVFTPVTPCRLFDTRLAGGYIGDNSNRDFYVVGSNLSAQGGSAAGCGIPSTPAAIAITITSVASTGAGDIRAWPYGRISMPLASVLNYNNSQYGDIATGAVVPICQGCAYELTLRTDGHTTHVIGDIAGYFWSPPATAVDVTEVSATCLLPGNTDYNLFTPDCLAGTAVTGGGFTSQSWTNVSFVSSLRFGNGWAVAAHNNTATPTMIYAYAYCAKIPGR